MAQKQKEERVPEKRTQTSTSTQVEIDTEREKIRVGMQKLDSRIEILANNVLESEQNNGAEDFNTVISAQFLDVACTMKEVMKTVENLENGMDIMFDTLDLFDSFMNLFDLSLDRSLKKKYTFGSNLMQRVKTKRAIKNVQRRVEAFTQSVANIMTIANTIQDSMSGLALNINTSMKRRKNTNLDVKPEKYELQNGTAKKLMEAKRKANNPDSTPASADNTSTSSTPSTPSTGDTGSISGSDFNGI